ncbi:MULTISPECIES: hypothetical protein [unclassified Streptomyces]|uniref:hypothetical protein n=1 Tax=unclassified Streptomyces TaxID=2593676 RepID=UPI000B0D5E14|nr:hypothetical protein [Streptomyces sp. CNQ-509]
MAAQQLAARLGPPGGVYVFGEPSGGRDGGRVLFGGTPAEPARAAEAATAEYLRRDLAG